MRYWLGIHLAIVLGFFALAVVFWGAESVVWLSMTIGLLCTYFRIELAALSRNLMHREDILVVSLVLLFLGFVLILLQYLFKELYWYLKELFFGGTRTNLLWEFGRTALVATGVGMTWSRMHVYWVAKLRSRFVGVQQLHAVFFSVLLGSKFLKPMCLLVFPMIFSFGMVSLVGIVLVVVGWYSWSEIFGEASVDLAEGPSFIMMFGGLLLTNIPMYYLSHRWWSRDILTEALGREVPD